MQRGDEQPTPTFKTPDPMNWDGNCGCRVSIRTLRSDTAIRYRGTLHPCPRHHNYSSTELRAQLYIAPCECETIQVYDGDELQHIRHSWFCEEHR